MRVGRTEAQAKVNLWLKVGARDASGYHEIATIFHRIDLADVVVVRAGGTVRAIDCVGPMLPADGLGPAEKNLAYRAAAAFAEATGWPRGFAIEVTKKIPVGGGLGGGSADAAAVLRVLNALAGKRLETPALQALAERLGADVAFLASDHVAAIGGGRGEKLLPFAPLPAREVLVVVPEFGVSTADAYGWIDAARGDQESRTLTEHVSLRMLSSWALMASFAENEFEPVVEARHPELADFRHRLVKEGAIMARLSGSGSAVFGVFEGRAPGASRFDFEARVIPTRTSARVVQVEVLE